MLDCKCVKSKRSVSSGRACVAAHYCTAQRVTVTKVLTLWQLDVRPLGFRKMQVYVCWCGQWGYLPLGLTNLNAETDAEVHGLQTQQLLNRNNEYKPMTLVQITEPLITILLTLVGGTYDLWPRYSWMLKCSSCSLFSRILEVQSSSCLSFIETKH